MALSTSPGHGADYTEGAGSTGPGDGGGAGLRDGDRSPGGSSADRRGKRKPNDLTLADDYVAQVGHWTDQAMCVDKTAIFFAPPGEREGRRRRREALASAYCAVCPIQARCKQAGREGREHGIWGGENDEQRALAGFAPRSPHRRSVAEAARTARQRSADDSDDIAVEFIEQEPS